MIKLTMLCLKGPQQPPVTEFWQHENRFPFAIMHESHTHLNTSRCLCKHGGTRKDTHATDCSPVEKSLSFPLTLVSTPLKDRRDVSS